MEKLTASSVVARGSGFVEAEADGEMVALNIDRGSYYGLDKIGTRIWALIAEPCKVADMCQVLVSEYDVDPATCELEVLDLLEDLRLEGMVDLRETTTR